MGYKVNGQYQVENTLVRREFYSDGGLWLWGWNIYGQLGTSDGMVSSPIQTVAGGTNWKQCAGGQTITVAIKTDGTLWSWGNNNAGQLGDNTTILKSSPVQTIAGGTNWKQCSVGNSNTTAIKTDGTLWTWGLNSGGQLGDNTIVSKSSPIQTIAGGTNWKQVSSGFNYVAAVKTDGTLWSWGVGGNGNLGDNTAISKSSPVQTVAGGTNWKSVACGQAHTTAVKTDGTLWSWGGNTRGQLGDLTIIPKSSPIQTIAGGTNWKQVAVCNKYTAAIKTDGTLWCWGDNYYGNLGNVDIIPQSSPIQTIAGGTNWKSVACGYFHAMAIKTDGTLWSWGQDNYGQLGDNTIVHKSSPVQTVAGGTNWKTVAGGYYHTMATTDLTL
jgi:alpha-tubulin suppressor-like RCC1 family protein